MAARVHPVQVRLLIDLIAAGPANLAVEPAGFTAELVQSEAGSTDDRRAYREAIDLTLDLMPDGQMMLEGVAHFTPADMSPALSELTLNVHYLQQPLFRQLLGSFAVEPFTELLVLRDLVLDRVLRRIGPGWYPIRLGGHSTDLFTNLALEFEGVPATARHRAKADLLRLLVRNLEDLRREYAESAGGARVGLILIRHSSGFPDASEDDLDITTEPSTHAAVIDHYLGWDYLRDNQHGNPDAESLFDFFASELLTSQTIDAVESPHHLAVGAEEPEFLIRVKFAPLQTARFVNSLQPDEVGLSLLGVRTSAQSRTRCAVDLSALSRLGAPRVLKLLADRPFYGGARTRATRMPEWFKVSPASDSQNQHFFGSELDEVAWGCSALASASTVRSGVFVTSEGRHSDAWISLRDTMTALEADADRRFAPLIQRTVPALLDRLYGEWRRTACLEHRDEPMRQFYVLNLCSRESGICSEFPLFYDPAAWAAPYAWSRSVGNINFQGERTTITNADVAHGIAKRGHADVALLTPFDTYEESLLRVAEFVGSDPSNRLILAFTLYSLPPSRLARAAVVGAEVIPLVQWDGRLLHPLPACDEILVLHPWLTQTRHHDAAPDGP